MRLHDRGRRAAAGGGVPEDAGSAARPHGGISRDRFGASVRSVAESARQHQAAEIGRAHVELQSLMRISYAVFCLKKKNKITTSIHYSRDTAYHRSITDFTNTRQINVRH